MSDRTKILYVDDESTNVLLFQIMFQNQFDVVTAGSGTEALKLLEATDHIDLIISDMKMPGLNGIEFLTRVRNINDQIPGVILSGYERNSQIDEAIDSGLILTYLTKPLVKDKILQLVSSLG